MTECHIKLKLDEMLKPATVKHLLEKREILRSIAEDVTQGNFNPSQRFHEFDKASEADIQRYVNDVPQLEKEVQELAKTVNAMAKQRSDDRTIMMTVVHLLYGAPLHKITDQRRRSPTANDSKKTLPLVLKLVQNLYLEFTTNYKKEGLMKIMEAFEHEERSGFRMLLREAPYCNGSDRQGSQLAAEIDAAGTKRLVAFNMEKVAFMRAIEDHPLADMTDIKGMCQPSSEAVETVIAGPDPKFSEQINALKEKFNKDIFKRIQARIPLVMAAHSVFNVPFQHADDAHINALPLHECQQALQKFVKLAQNLYLEITVCGKHYVVHQRELDFARLEKQLYKDAYLELAEKLDEQLAAASNTKVNERSGPMPAGQ